jgi:hypothetical protein
LLIGAEKRVHCRFARIAAICPLAVDRHRRRNDQLLELFWPLDDLFEQHGSTQIVRLYIPNDLVHRLAYAYLGRLMIDHVDAVQRLGDSLSIANVTPNKLRRRIQVLRNLVPVYLLNDRIQYPNPMSPLNQRIN